jgi:cytochrome c oxidase subunit 2
MRRRNFRFGAVVLIALTLTGCLAQPVLQNVPSALDPRGPAAVHLANLWWLLFWLGTLIYLIVLGALGFALYRRRRGQDDLQDAGRPSEDRGRRAIVWAGLILPALVLVIVFGFTLGALRATAVPESSEDLVIEVVGRRWWWEVHYPNRQIETANEIHIPTGQPVQLKLTSEEVIHSFWVPQLHGKMDANPNMVNTFWIQADEPGEYWGECAEFCGVQHAKMLFVVVAEPPEQFAAWLERERQPAASPTDPLARQGESVFLSSGCMNCHAVRGTHATGELGPDLTHFGSRRTLASGSVANTRGNLGGWIADPHSIKPGNLMPPTALSGEDLNALLAYLEALK